MGNDMSAFLKQLDQIEKKVDGIKEKVDGIKKKVDRIDLRTTALVESAYRSRHPRCDFKEIVSAEDAVRLLSTPETESATAKVIPRMSRN